MLSNSRKWKHEQKELSGLGLDCRSEGMRVDDGSLYCAAIASFTLSFGLQDQIPRSSVSIMSNIAAILERHSSNEVHHFLNIAKTSCAKVHSQLPVAMDVGLWNQGNFANLIDLLSRVTQITRGICSSINNRRAKA